MAARDWDGERRDRPRRERGSEPAYGPGGFSQSRSKQASKQRLDAEIARLRANFAPLPYGEQLGYLTDVRRSLNRLLHDEDAVAEVVRKQFKPLLKTGGGRKPPRPPMPLATASSGHFDEGAARSGPSDPRREALLLISRRPGRMTRNQCFKALNRGTCVDCSEAEIKAAIRALLRQGTVVMGKQGHLCPAS